MAYARFTVAEVLEVLKGVHKSIDLRAAVVKVDQQWKNVLTVLRFSYEDPQTVEKRVTSLERQYEKIHTASLQVIHQAFPVERLTEVQSQLSSRKAIIKGIEYDLSRDVELRSLSGYIKRYYSLAREPETLAWPALEVAQGERSLALGREDVQREILKLGYSSIESILNVLLELKLTSGHSLDFLVQVPVPAMIERVVVKNQKAEIDIIAHQALKGLAVFLFRNERDRLRGDTLKQKSPVSLRPSEEQETLSRFHGSVVLGDGYSEDIIEISLTHPDLADIDRCSNPMRTLIDIPERNPLLATVEQFCPEEELRQLLTQPSSMKDSSMQNPGKLFERSIAWLLTLVGFQAIALGGYENLRDPATRVERGSVDVLAYHKAERILLLANCTIGTVQGEDIDKLREVKRILAEHVLRGSRLRPILVIFSAATELLKMKERGAGSDVKVVSRDDLEVALRCLKRGMESAILDFLLSPLSIDLQLPGWLEGKSP